MNPRTGMRKELPADVMYPLKRISSGAEHTDEHGTYEGMKDFLFTRQTPRSQFAVVQYRDSFDEAYMPHGSNGALTLKKYPQGQPPLQHLKAPRLWRFKGSTTIEDTVRDSLQNRSSASVTREELMQEWQTRLSHQVPSTIELLSQDLRLIFVV